MILRHKKKTENKKDNNIKRQEESKIEQKKTIKGQKRQF